VTTRFCPREHDVLMLVSIGQWPRQAEAELVLHVASCSSCAEAAVVAAAVRELDQDEALAHLPDACVVWQRAQWQARREEMQRAARPVVAMQGIAAICILTMIVLATAWLSTRMLFADRLAGLWKGLQAAAASIGTTALTVADLFTFEIQGNVVLLLAGAIALGLTAVAVAIGLSTLADVHREPRRR
jgi:hypothetical protein